MRKAILILLVCTVALLPGILVAGQNFDGTWHTTLTCPPKGNTEGYTWKFDSIIQDGNLHGARGAAGEPGYLLIEGKIAQDGHAKLSANGIVTSRKYARGVFTGKGDDYSYDIKAQFSETEGQGVRNQGLGIVGRPCTFEFVKQQATTTPVSER
jgi:hypothetical protein